MRIAVIGCSHGTLDDIYASVLRADIEAEKLGEAPIDLMICCGDFQAMRSTPDLQMMACPPKYRSLGQFHNYYAERKRAPVLTLLVGGNHESSGYLWECYHGGWLAPDIYFLGFAGCVLVDGWLRIGGASGIWKSGDWKKGHHETVPYNDSTIRSVYHIREYDVARLLQLKGRGEAPDVFISHDWPLGVEQHGDTQALIREKPFFKEEVAANTLGSPPLHALLTTLQPSYWFAAHLHVKFAALYHHSGQSTTLLKRNQNNGPIIPVVATVEKEVNPDEIVLEDEEEEEGGDVVMNVSHAVSINPDEIALDEGEEDEEPKGTRCACEPGKNPDEIALESEEEELEVSKALDPKVVSEVEVEKQGQNASASGSRSTRFLALSKPGPGKDFLQVVEIPTSIGFERPLPPPTPSAAELPPADEATGTILTPLSETAVSTLPMNASESPISALPATPISKTRYRPTLYFDPHWLSIVKTYAPYLSLKYSSTPLPPTARAEIEIAKNLEWVRASVGKEGMIKVDDVQIFARTAPGTDEFGRGMDGPPSWYTNPQTEAFCSLLSIPNQINPAPEGFKEAQALRQAADSQAQATRQALADEEKVKREGWAREERERREEWEALELIKAKEAALAEMELLDVEEESGKDVKVAEV